MKILKYAFLATLSISSFMACGNDKNSGLIDENEKDLTFKATINSQLQAKTRAVGATWEAQDAIGVYMKKAGGNLPASILNAAFNIKHTTSGDGIFAIENIDDAISYPSNGDAVDFIAYYPFQSAISQNIYKVNVADQSAQAKIDLLYADNAKTLSNLSPADVNLIFSHQLSKIVLNVNAELEMEPFLTNLKIEMSGQKSEANFELADGKLTATSATDKRLELKQTPVTKKIISEAIILPATETSAMSFVFTLSDGREFSWSIPSATVFEKGKKYTYNATLKKVGGEEAKLVIPSAATITNWDDIPAEDIATKEEMPTSYKLVWEDSFNGTELDKNNWGIEVVPNPANNEYQYYRSENISVGAEPISGESCLIITAKKEDYNTRSFTSGRLNTLEKVAFRYGRLDARVKVPETGNGLWPAFWMKGNDNRSVPWPACGELDILEMGHGDGIKNGNWDRYVGAACHWGPSTYKTVGSKTIMPYSLQGDDFHLYTLIWDEDYIKIYLDLDKYPDNEPYYSFHYSANVDVNKAGDYFNKEYFILFNLAVGGGYTGITGAANIDKITALNAANNYEAKMYVDYIKIYQQGSENEQLTLP